LTAIIGRSRFLWAFLESMGPALDGTRGISTFSRTDPPLELTPHRARSPAAMPPLEHYLLLVSSRCRMRLSGGLEALRAERDRLQEGLRAIARIVSVSSLPNGDNLEILALCVVGPDDGSEHDGKPD
jgi:hypothetical protein